MVQAIGSSVTAGWGGTHASAGVLDAQLSRYQKQLADWCNCPSGKTPEGKAKIQELQDKADAVKVQLQRIAADKPQKFSTSESTSANPDSSANTDTASQRSVPSVPMSGIGGLLNVFA